MKFLLAARSLLFPSLAPNARAEAPAPRESHAAGGARPIVGRGRVLVIVSAARGLALRNGRMHPTGYFAGELVEPLWILRDEFDFDVATPGGVVPRLDTDSWNRIYWMGKSAQRQAASRFIRESSQIATPLSLSSISNEMLDRYTGVFFPGGHGPMVDLARDADVARVLRYFHGAQKPTGLLCHGPAALLSLAGDSVWPYAGYRMTGFSNWEEVFAQKFFLGGQVPYSMEDELRKRGARMERNFYFLPSWGGSHVIRDRELVTGQNPYSAREFGRAFLEDLRKFRSTSR